MQKQGWFRRTAAKRKAKQILYQELSFAETQAKADADRKQKEAEENKRLPAAQDPARQDSTAKRKDRWKNETC